MWSFGDIFPPFGVTSFISAVVVCFLGFSMFKRLVTDGNVSIRDSTKNHSWTPIKITLKVSTCSFFACSLHFLFKAWNCSICETLLLNGVGVYCDCCGVCADPECIKKANTQLKCKIITGGSENQPHHWVKGMIQRKSKQHFDTNLMNRKQLPAH